MTGLRPGLPTVQLDFPYVDVLRIQQQFGSGPAGGAHLAGGTKIGSRSWLGVGSVTKQLIEIGHDCTIGAGAAVVQNVYNDSTVMGVPARLKS